VTSSRSPSKLEAALDAARRGIPVFRLKPDSKKPAFEGWQYEATTDPERIKTMFEGFDWNIGGKLDGLGVPDVDFRNGGKPTFDELVKQERLDQPENHTLVSLTHSGGYHLIFRLPEGEALKSRPHTFGQGIDLKTGPGAYIVLPGSEINGNEYKWLRDRPIAKMPKGLIERAKAFGRPSDKSAAAGKRLVAEDDEAIERAERWLKEQAPAGEQGSRDNTAFQVAAKLYDFGVANGTAHELLSRWNYERCEPPLEHDEIARIADSASRNRQNPIGINGATASGFEAVEIDENWRPNWNKYNENKKGQVDNELKPFVSLATPFSFPDPTTINPPDWILEGLVARAEVSTVTGPGGVSKSTWQLHAAVAAVTGREDICGFRIPHREGHPRRERVWVWNQEDSLDTMNARVMAIMKEFGVSPDDLRDEHGKPMLFLDSGRGRGKRLTLVERKGEFFRATAQLDHVIKTAAHEGFGLTMLDPLVSLHQASENVNEQMRVVFDHLADIAHDAKCGVLVNCHTGKPDKKSSEGYAGDAYAIRGGSSQPDAARVAATLMSMSQKDSKEWRIPQGHSHLNYARLDVAKINDGPKPSSPYWYWRKQIIVPGYRGGPLPVLRPIDLERVVGETNAENMAAQIAQAIRDHHALETWVSMADLLPHLPIDLAKRLSGKNRARELDSIFIARDEVTVEGFGVLRRMTESGRRGTKLMLSAIPHSSNSSN
jgi:hypothetical protein